MNARCDSCRSLRFEQKKPTADIGALAANDIRVTLICVLHRTKESWLQSIIAGCHLCSLVKGQVYTCETASSECDAFGAYAMLKCTVWPERGVRPLLPSLQIVSRLGGASLSIFDQVSDPYLKAFDAYAAKYARPRPSLSYGQSLEDRRSSDAQHTPFNAELACLWRDECLNNHTLCQLGSRINGSAPRLPTRLIDVSDVENLFIQETDILRDCQYVALSYCWGQGKKFLTIKENYQSFKSRIPFCDLPKTFSNAVVVAHNLGYRYIWIDALCIIQDDPSDLKTELQYMCDIYRFAVLTICAEGAASSHSGLFAHLRSPLSLAPCKVEVTLDLEAQDTGAANHQYEITLSGNSVGKDYLTPRGWILQEDVLTARALRFSVQMSWRCRQSVLSETQPTPPPRLPSGRKEHLKPGNPRLGVKSISDPLKRLREYLYATPAARRHEQDGEIFLVWYNMLQIYSDKELSFPSDTLRALSGISSMFAQTYGTTYLAGLWKEDLIRGLSWYVAVNDSRAVIGGTGSTKKAAPSWTWASVGKVRIRFACLEQSHYVLERGRVVSEDLVNKNASERRGPVGEILDAYCAWDDPLNEGGTVSDRMGQEWSLRLRTAARRAVLRIDERYSEWRINSRTYGAAITQKQAAFDAIKTLPGLNPRFPGLLLDGDDDQVIIGEAALDSGGPLAVLESNNRDTTVGMVIGRAGGNIRGGESYREVEVLCLILDYYELWKSSYAICLVVVPRHAGSSSFTRVGLGFLQQQKEGGNLKLGDGDSMDCEIV